MATIVYRELQSRIRRESCAPLFLHRRPTREHLAWSSRDSCRGSAIWEAVDQLLYSGNILIQAKSRPVALSTSSNNINTEESQRDSCQHRRSGLHSIADSSSPIEKNYLCCKVRQISIPSYLQAVVPARVRGTWLMKIETHRKIFDRQCSMTGRDIQGNPTWKAVLLPHRQTLLQSW